MRLTALLFLSSILMCQHARAGISQACQSGNAVFYLNGIWTDGGDAYDERKALEKDLASYISGTPADADCILVRLAYNSTYGKYNIGDLVEALKQLYPDGNTITFWRMLGRL